MQCLAPFEPPDAGPREAAATRLPWFAIALALSAVLGAAVLLDWRSLFDTLRRHTVLQAELAVCAGTLGGLILSQLEGNPLARRRLAQLERMYERVAGTPIAVEPGYSHYLPCVLLVCDESGANLAARLRAGSESQLLTGATASVLYIGPSGVQVRTAGTGSRDRHSGVDGRALAGLVAAGRAGSQTGPFVQRIHMGTVREVTITAIALPRGQFAKVTRSRPRTAVLIRSSAGQVVIAIPSIGDTLPRLHRCLDELRWGGAPWPGARK